MDIESYIKDLPPELQEKARACGSIEELLALAKESKVPVPDEALAAIAGGDQPDPENCKPAKITCPRCGSENIKLDYTEKDPNYAWTTIYHYYCYNCAYTWVTHS